MAGAILKAAVRLTATMIAALTFLAAQPQGVAAYIGSGGDSSADTSLTGIGPGSPQPAAKIPGSGTGPVLQTGGGTKGGTKGGTRGTGTGGGTNTGTAAGTTGTGGNGTDTGTDTTGDTGTVAGTGPTATTPNTAETGTATIGTATTATVDTVTEEGEEDVDVEEQQAVGTLGVMQGPAALGVQSLPSTSTPAADITGAIAALGGALFAISRRFRR